MGTQQQTNVSLKTLEKCDLNVSGDIDFFSMLAQEAPALGNFVSSQFSSNNADNIAIAECNARRRIKQFELGGLKQSAANLKHYLSGSGTDLKISAKEYRALPKILELESECMRRWELAVIGAKPHPAERNFSTFKEILNTWDSGKHQAKTPKDNFLLPISRTESIAISKDFSLSWGQSHLQSLAATGLVVNLNSNYVSINGTITFASLDFYDFQLGLPGSFDGKLLEQAGIAKEFLMITKWEREFQANYEMRPAAARFWQPLDRPAAEPNSIEYQWGDPVLDGPLSAEQDYRDKVGK